MKFLLLITLTLTLNAQEATVKQLFNIQTVQVKQNTHAKQMKSFGFVTTDESKVYDVAPRFGGYVEVLYADKLYKKVAKGEALARVYSPEVLKAKDEYKNSLHYSRNKVMLQSAKKKLQLLNIPDSEIKNMSANRSLTTITSPANGYIFKKTLKNNSAFKTKDVLFEVVNLDTVWVEVKIHQDQYRLLDTMTTYTLSTPSLEETFTATNAGVYPMINPKEESFTLRLEVENPKTVLKPGMYMNIAMKQAAQNYLTLPTTSVIRKNGTFYVFSVGEFKGEYEPLEVQVEALNPDTYIVKSGLQAGDEVVNNAIFMMDSDAQISALY